MNLPDTIRHRHIHSIGQTQSGKSTLLLNLAWQDIQQGKGVGVIDPHGDFAERLLDVIPANRKDDVIYFDAADPVSINVTDCRIEEQPTLADDLLIAFRRSADNQPHERMDAILRYAFSTILKVPHSTFLDIAKLLDPAQRKDYIKLLPDQYLCDWWRRFPFEPKAVNPILSRLAKYLLSPPIVTILGTKDARLNFSDVLQKKQVLIVNLCRGKVGESTASLIGSIIVSKIQQAAFRRAALPIAERIPFYLYVDEFHNFTTSAFDTILSEAAKYRLCLTVAHQYLEQLEPKLRLSITKNPGTVIDFSNEMRMYDGPPAEYHAYIKTPDGAVCEVRTPPPIRGKTGFAEYIKKRTKDAYYRPPAEDVLQMHRSDHQTRPKAARRGKPNDGYTARPPDSFSPDPSS